MDQEDVLLKHAEHCVLLGEAQVTRMTALISRRAASGLDTAGAEAHLERLLAIVDDMHEHLICQQERYRSRWLGLHSK